MITRGSQPSTTPRRVDTHGCAWRLLGLVPTAGKASGWLLLDRARGAGAMAVAMVVVRVVMRVSVGLWVRVRVRVMVTMARKVSMT